MCDVSGRQNSEIDVVIAVEDAKSKVNVYCCTIAQPTISFCFVLDAVDVPGESKIAGIGVIELESGSSVNGIININRGVGDPDINSGGSSGSLGAESDVF